MIEYTGDTSFPGACTLQPRLATRTSQNATTLCLADPAAMWAPPPPPQATAYTGSNDHGSAKVRVGAWEERISCTRTRPSNQPDTMI